MLITPEDGSAPFYAKIEMADTPMQLGTPFNKQNILQDATTELFGLNNSAVPDTIFSMLPAVRYGLVYREITTSTQWEKPADMVGNLALVIAVGGGGGGSDSNAGGGSGHIEMDVLTLENDTTYEVTIGAGGAVGAAGGTTSFGTLLTAQGGSPGTSTKGGDGEAGGCGPYVKGGTGGNGRIYGGGGGGGANQDGGGKGGNGGTFGGGGGGGGPRWGTVGQGGIGGTYGGNGAVGKAQGQAGVAGQPGSNAGILNILSMFFPSTALSVGGAAGSGSDNYGTSGGGGGGLGSKGGPGGGYFGGGGGGYCGNGNKGGGGLFCDAVDEGGAGFSPANYGGGGGNNKSGYAGVVAVIYQGGTLLEETEA